MNSPQNSSTSPPHTATDASSSGRNVQRIEYEAPQAAKGVSELFHVAFVSGFVLGAIILNMVDDLGHRFLAGYPKVGALLCLTCPAIIAVLAGPVRQISPRYRSAAFALVFTVVGPLLLYLGGVSLYLLTR